MFSWNFNSLLFRKKYSQIIWIDQNNSENLTMIIMLILWGLGSRLIKQFLHLFCIYCWMLDLKSKYLAIFYMVVITCLVLPLAFYTPFSFITVIRNTFISPFQRIYQVLNLKYDYVFVNYPIWRASVEIVFLPWHFGKKFVRNFFRYLTDCNSISFMLLAISLRCHIIFICPAITLKPDIFLSSLLSTNFIVMTKKF